jgi:hypothetical protein
MTMQQTQTQGNNSQEKAQQMGQQAKEGAKQAGNQLSGQTKDAFSLDSDRPVESYVAIWEKVPTNAYWAAAAGSIGLSALLMLSGKQRAAIFVGQWPPTIIALALMNKLLRPSREVSGS